MAEYILTPKQYQAYQLLTDLNDRTILYGGAKGGGKTYLFCTWVLGWALQLIDLYHIEPSKYPTPIGFIGRKRAVDFNDTTMETWKRVVPADCYRFR